MFNVLRLVHLALFIASASSTTLNTPRAPSIDAPFKVARVPGASTDESIFFPVRETNAKRMARGLGPATPNFERATILPGRRHIPTRMGSARRSVPSGSVNTPVTGTIKITRADNGALVGYVNEDYTSGGTRRYGITTDAANALQVTTLVTQNSYTTIELQEPTPTDAAHPLLGAVVGPANSGDNLSSGSYNYALLTGTSHTDANSPPSAAGNSYSSQNSESTIWTYLPSSLVNRLNERRWDTHDRLLVDLPSTQQLTAQWVNPDGSKPTTFLYYLPGSNALLLTGDVSAFNSAFPGGYPVVLTLV